MLGLGCCGGSYREPLVPEGHTALSREQLKQLYDHSLSVNGGRLLLHGVFARADTRNTNRRVYPKAVLKREVKKYKAQHIKAGTALGELDHPSYSSQLFKYLNLPNVSHQVLSVKWRGSELWGTIEILPTPSGLLLWELYSKGIRLGVSSRGWASLVQDPKTKAMLVDDDFELITFDFVTEPSTRDAFLVPICRQYRKPVPDQKHIVQLSHMGVGAVAMDNVRRLPAAVALHARLRALRKQQQACQMAVEAAGDLAVMPAAQCTLHMPPLAAAPTNSQGMLQPLGRALQPQKQQQQLERDADGLLLTSHYSTEEADAFIQPDPHGRHLPTHLSMFATRAHLADNHMCGPAHASKGYSSIHRNQQPCSLASASGAASSSGSLQAALAPASLTVAGPQQPHRVQGCGLKDMLQSQLAHAHVGQRVRPHLPLPDASTHSLAASGLQLLPDVTGQSDTGQPSGAQQPWPPAASQQQLQHSDQPSQQADLELPHSSVVDHQSAHAAMQTTYRECPGPPGVATSHSASHWQAGAATPPAQQQPQQQHEQQHQQREGDQGATQLLQRLTLQQQQQQLQHQQPPQHACAPAPPAPPPPPLQQPVHVQPALRRTTSSHSRSHSMGALPPPSCGKQASMPGPAGGTPREPYRLAVPVAAGVVAAGAAAAAGDGGHSTRHDPEYENIKHTLASYKAKCTAAQLEMLQALPG